MPFGVVIFFKSNEINRKWHSIQMESTDNNNLLDTIQNYKTMAVNTIMLCYELGTHKK